MAIKRPEDEMERMARVALLQGMRHLLDEMAAYVERFRLTTLQQPGRAVKAEPVNDPENMTPEERISELFRRRKPATNQRWWNRLTAEERAAHIAKMQAGRKRKR